MNCRERGRGVLLSLVEKWHYLYVLRSIVRQSNASLWGSYKASRPWLSGLFQWGCRLDGVDNRPVHNVRDVFAPVGLPSRRFVANLHAVQNGTGRRLLHLPKDLVGFLPNPAIWRELLFH